MCRCGCYCLQISSIDAAVGALHKLNAVLAIKYIK